MGRTSFLSMAGPRSLAVLMLVTRVLADVQDADDTNVGMFYTGLWVPDGDPNTFGKHDTWTNQSGASVVFDFIGTEISVFVTRRPVGTYLSNASFSVDGGPPTLWTTSDPVPAISYKNKVYTSPSLPPAQHRITVTNFGEIFWLDYMEYTLASAPPNGNPPPGTTSTSTSDAPNSSSTNTPTPSVSVTPVGTPTVGASTSATDARPPSTTSSAPGTQSPNVSGAPAGTAAPTSDTHGSTAAPATDTHTDTQSSSVSAVPAGTAASASAAQSSSSHTGIIVGIVVGVLGGIALLISAIWWLRLRSQARQFALAATPFAESSMRAAVFPARELPMTQRGLPPHSTRLYAPASDPGGYYDRPAPLTLVERPQSEPGGRSSSKHNTFFQAHEAPPHSIPYHGLYAPVSSPSSVSAGDTEIILEAIPEDQIRMSSSTGLASSPNTPEMASARSARSTWLPRALTFSSASQRSVPNATSPPAAPGPRYFRVLRQSRDGGVRIAGGRLGEHGAQPWTPAAYDDGLDVRSESSTMPPSYAQFASAVSGE